MKILLLSNKFPFPLRDGGSIAVYNIARELSELGHEITLLTMSTPKHRYSSGNLPDRENVSIRIEQIYVNTEIRILKAFVNFIFSKLPYNAVRFISKKYTHRLIGLLKETSFDIVQLEGLYLMPYLKIIRQHSDAIISFRAHNIEHEIWKRHAGNIANPLIKWYLQLMTNRLKHFEIRALNSYDLLIPITERDADKFSHLGNTRPLHVCPAGVKINDKKSTDNHVGINALFYIGSLDWMPNQEGLTWFLKKVWPAVNQRFPTLQFYIAGRNAPKQLVRKFKIKNCNYVGEVSNAAEFMKPYAVMIVPLFSGSGMRIKIIEGMSFGKTVITTTTGAEGLNATHRKSLLIADTADDFINEIIFMINHPEECQKIGKSARKFVETNFDNSRIISDLEKFYKLNLR